MCKCKSCNIKTVFGREFKSYFDSPVAYVFLVAFLVLVGFMTFGVAMFYGDLTAEQTRRPEMTVNITDAKVASQVLRMIERLEDCDDVQNVTANYLIDDSIADQIEE